MLKFIQMKNRITKAGTKANSSKKAAVKKSSQTIAKPYVGRSLFGSLEIDADETGFTIWVKERKFIAGKERILKHWIIDASNLKKDGCVRMGEKDMYRIEARYDKNDNCLQVGVK
jgi:hypothetical protein